MPRFQIPNDAEAALIWDADAEVYEDARCAAWKPLLECVVVVAHTADEIETLVTRLVLAEAASG